MMKCWCGASECTGICLTVDHVVLSIDLWSVISTDESFSTVCESWFSPRTMIKTFAVTLFVQIDRSVSRSRDSQWFGQQWNCWSRWNRERKNSENASIGIDDNNYQHRRNSNNTSRFTDVNHTISVGSSLEERQCETSNESVGWRPCDSVSAETDDHWRRDLAVYEHDKDIHQLPRFLDQTSSFISASCVLGS